MKTLKTSEIIKTGQITWRNTIQSEIRTLSVLAIYSLIILIPILWFGYLDYTYDSGISTALLFSITVYLIFLHFSLAIAIIYNIDKNSEMNKQVTLADNFNLIANKIKPLSLISMFFMILTVIPLYFVDVYSAKVVLDSPILIGLVAIWNYIVLIIIGIPWFFSIAGIIFHDYSGLKSFKIAWREFYDEMVELLKVSSIAIFPVYVYIALFGGYGVYIADYYDYTIPSPLIFTGWLIVGALIGVIFFTIILPWSLNISYSLYRKLHSISEDNN